MFMSLN